MKIFNIGILEFIVIAVIALIVLGPDGIVKTARSLGRTIRKIIRSPIWSMMVDTQRELREMPTKLVREAGLEEDLAEIRKTTQELKKINSEVGQIIPPAASSSWPSTAYKYAGKPIQQPASTDSSEAHPEADSHEGDCENHPEVPSTGGQSDAS